VVRKKARRANHNTGGGSVKIRYSQKAVKQLKTISKGDKKSAVMILTGVEAYATNPQGAFDVKVLKGKLGDIKRLRVGKYRILFGDENDVISVYEVKHRREAYSD
jgi:mRNA-degrading endonuclease RelE of RelBE toxin-antitoxin system